ncbi:MAG TPA: methionyl-tRNA formyltransferase [Vicinamibacterales bacterium]|nr:methionyl-tRNA formyltransferase [Vicinamibacterales bacterium]
MRVIFFGTPAFAVPTLDALVAAGHDVVGVVTQPDRPRGRGQKVQPSEVKARALEHGLPVLQPDRLREPAMLDSMRALGPDLGVVAAYGRILPQSLLDLPRLGMLNVHASLLPRWRGAAPVHRAVLAGDAETGVTIMRVVLQLDAGPMLAREKTDIGGSETSGELEGRLAIIGGRLLATVVDGLRAGTVEEIAQDEALVTYAKRLERSESPIDWRRSATEVHNQIRGLQPWPLASTMLGGKRLLLRRAEVERGVTGSPGTIVGVDHSAIHVAAGTGAVRILELQPEGRPVMTAHAFANGHRVAVGARFETPAP